MQGIMTLIYALNIKFEIGGKRKHVSKALLSRHNLFWAFISHLVIMLMTI